MAEREGFDLLPEMGFKPTNKYLPPRVKRDATVAAPVKPVAQSIKPANGAFVLLGRKRQEPLSSLPPLRFETFINRRKI